jgi:hypothetical protein
MTIKKITQHTWTLYKITCTKKNVYTKDFEHKKNGNRMTKLTHIKKI